MQYQRTVRTQPVEALGKKLLTACTAFPRAGGLRLVRQCQDQPTQPGVSSTDALLALGCAALVLAAGGRPRRPDIDRSAIRAIVAFRGGGIRDFRRADIGGGTPSWQVPRYRSRILLRS